MTEQRNRDAEAIIANLARPSRGVGAISAYLQRAIETGAYSEGDRLPPERQLAETFQAARSTVRRALDQLEKAGLVSRRLGSGTFVGATSTGTRRASDLADQVSPLQLVAARLAVEPSPRRSPPFTRHNEISTRWGWYLLMPSSRSTTRTHSPNGTASFIC